MNNEIKCEQLSEEWFHERLSRITGSKFQKLMPTKRQKPDAWSDGQLTILREIAAQILTGERAETFTNTAMQWGIDNEPNARRAFELHEMTTVRECGIFSYSDNIGASPDGIIESTRESWETKCPMSKQHLKYYLDPDELFNDYEWQCVGEAICTGFLKGVICSYDPRYPDDKMLVIHRFKVSYSQFKKWKDRMALAVDLIREWTAIQVDF